MGNIGKFIGKIKSKINPLWTTRPMIDHIRQGDNSHLIGVEVGVYRGDNAANILSVLNVSKLYLIDPYVPYPFKKGYTEDFMESLYRGVRRRFRKDDRVILLRERSEGAVERFDDESLDFVYIDGDHSYEVVKKDIEMWWPKVKEKGVLGDHDFNSSHAGVLRAVIEKVNRYNWDLQAEERDWWVEK